MGWSTAGWSSSPERGWRHRRAHVLAFAAEGARGGQRYRCGPDGSPASKARSPRRGRRSCGRAAAADGPDIRDQAANLIQAAVETYGGAIVLGIVRTLDAH